LLFRNLPKTQFFIHNPGVGNPTAQPLLGVGFSYCWILVGFFCWILVGFFVGFFHFVGFLLGFLHFVGFLLGKKHLKSVFYSRNGSLTLKLTLDKNIFIFRINKRRSRMKLNKDLNPTKIQQMSKNLTKIQQMSQKPNKNQTILPKNPTNFQQKNPTLKIAVGCWVLQKTQQKTQHFVGFVGF
jgi:hypothetical protein